MTAQAETALRRANEVRFAGAEVKRQLRAGEVTLAQALEDPAAGSLFVDGRRGILRALPGWGERKAGRAMAAAGVLAPRRIRELTDRQRELLGRFATDGRSR